MKLWDINAESIKLMERVIRIRPHIVCNVSLMDRCYEKGWS